MIAEQELRAIAFLAARCRPSHSPHAEWDEAGILANLRKVAAMSLPEVILATTRAAMNPAAKSPGVIPVLGGEHWRDKPAEPTERRLHPPKASEVCPEHGGWASNCPGCAADRLAGDEPPPRGQPASPEQISKHLADFRNTRTNTQETR